MQIAQISLWIKTTLRAWLDKLSNTLLKFGFIKSKPNNSIIFLINSDFRLYDLVYIDDIIITGSYDHKISLFVDLLNKKFSLKDMGTLHYILGIEVIKLIHGSLLLHQSKYIGALLPKTYFIDAKLMVSPIVYFVKLFDSDGFPINSI